MSGPVLLAARGLRKAFRVRDQASFRPWQPKTRLHALAGVDLDVRRGECLALVGESGCGKTTLGRCLVGHLAPDEGFVRVDEGTALVGRGAARGSARRAARRRFQMVFQDSAGALDPRLRADAILREALRPGGLRGVAATDRVAELLHLVGLDPARHLDRFPHQLSGGQRQRLAIARALSADPDLVVLDEPVSALDASVRERILDLLGDLRRRLGLTLVFIGHDLGVVRRVADRVAVLYLGRIVEIGAAGDVLSAPRHPYTAALLDSVPRLPSHLGAADALPARPAVPLRGDVPSAIDPPPGCPFHPRCPRAEERCRLERPGLEELSARETQRQSVAGTVSGTVVAAVACHFPRHPFPNPPFTDP